LCYYGFAFHNGLVFVAVIFFHYKVYHIATSCAAVATKAMPGVCFGVDLKARRFVFVKGTA
jgi:hypothetical protein